MKYKTPKEERTSFLRLTTVIQELIYSKEFKEQAKKRAADFTRSRKMPFSKMILFMINQVKTSTQTALDHFFDLIGATDLEMTQQSFSEARQKLKWETCRELMETTVKSVYEGGFSTWHGYRVSAIDGSKIQLPGVPAMKAAFGTAGRGSTAPTAQSSCLYDILNDVILDAEIVPMYVDERTLAKLHIARLGLMTPSVKELVILDRGYASFDLIKAFMTVGISFLMRVRHKFNVEIDALPLGDHEFVLTQGEESLKLRVVKFKLPGGEVETLITDLTDKRMGIKAFQELYFLRWPIETKYGELKHKLEIENFSGRTPDAIRQDYYITAFLTNMISVAANEAQPIIDAAAEGKENKYEYQVNKNHAVGVFKDRFIMALLDPNLNRQSRTLKRILKLLSKHATPKRPGRSNPRNPNPRRANFHFNQKSNC